MDIETFPNLVWTWGVRKQFIAPNQIERPGGVLCFAWKWLGRRGTEFRSLKDDGRRKMIRRAHDLLSEADAVISYNGERFDGPRLNQEFFLAKLAPPAPFRHIDLWKTAKEFQLPHSKFECVLRVTGLGAKVEHEGFPLWRKCMGGPEVPKADYERAWRTMRRYNIADTEQMEPLYLEMLPWIKRHPNAAQYDGLLGRCCPTCGSEKLQARGVARTATVTYRRFQCRSCGKWSRSRAADHSYGKPELVAA